MTVGEDGSMLRGKGECRTGRVEEKRDGKRIPHLRPVCPCPYRGKYFELFKVFSKGDKTFMRVHVIKKDSFNFLYISISDYM